MSSKKENTRMLLATASISLALMLSACDNDNNKTEPPVKEKTKAEKILGIWDQPGYGRIFVVSDDNTMAYQFTRNSCLGLDEETGRFGMSDEEVNEANVTFTDNNDTLSAKLPGFAFSVQFKRLNSLPEVCKSSLVQDTSTAIFNHYWNTFNDYYAFNNERSVNWAAQFTTVSHKIFDGMTDDALFSALSEMIEPLDDGHTSLVSDSDEFSPEKIKGGEKFILDSFASQTEFDDLEEYTSAVTELYFGSIESSLDEDTIKTSHGLQWGKTSNGVGYLFIESMFNFTENEDASDGEELLVLDPILDEIFTDLRDTPAMIVDVSLNPGGSDSISLAIANRFTDQHRQVMSKTTRTFAGETSPVFAYIDPANDQPYLKPVALITGKDTGSAAEIFVIAMRSLPQVTTVGEATNGALSDILDKELPNSWEFGLSNEVYLDHQGISHEVSGIAPQVEVALFSIEALEDERNPGIEKALEILGFSSDN